MENEKKNIAAIFAHPDDETLGCGGTLARLSQLGHKVSIIICGEGITARYESPEMAPAIELEALDKSLSNAAKCLGVKNVIHLDWPDNRFDQRPLLDLTKAIEKELKVINPNVIFTHHTGDLNMDHRYVYDAVMAATRPLPGSKIKQIYSCEVLSSTNWAGPASTPFMPTRFVDISDTLDKKIEAMSYYDSEVAPFPHPRSPKAIKAQAQFRGAESGLLAAEAFMVVRQIVS